MADKMMRIAGRGTDGTAKPFSTDDEGNLNTKSVGGKVTYFTFQDKVKAWNQGETLMLSGEKTLKVDITGTSPNYTIEFQCRGMAAAWTSISGVNLGTFDIQNKLQVKDNSVANTQIFQIDVEGLHSVRFRTVAIDSSNTSQWVSIKGSLIW